MFVKDLVGPTPQTCPRVDFVQSGLVGENEFELAVDHRLHQFRAIREVVVELRLATARGGQYVIEAGGTYTPLVHYGRCGVDNGRATATPTISGRQLGGLSEANVRHQDYHNP